LGKNNNADIGSNAMQTLENKDNEAAKIFSDFGIKDYDQENIKEFSHLLD